MNVTKRACVPQTQGYMSALGDLSEDDSEDEDETGTLRLIQARRFDGGIWTL